MLAPTAATALADGGRIEADAWREVAGTRHADLERAGGPGLHAWPA